jgi:tRNA-uridine 2-sulfurtransferase
MSARVLVAMSGGVDSSVAAALLREAGYQVVGVAMRLAPEPPHSARRRATCCSHEDFEDARRVAERLDFPFYVVDLREDFAARVVGNFVSEYLAGRTPNPCVMCNREIKFDRLWQRARALGADLVATGHYAQTDRDLDGRFHLRRARDTGKDQSYFLFSLTQSELARTVFPLGALTKAEVRARARELGLANADKPESQEICFVPDGDYAGLVERAAGRDRIRTGRIVDRAGTALGGHRGVHHFTIGQRRGLGIASGEPLYVREIHGDTGTVVVGRREELYSAGLLARDVSLVDGSRTARRLEVEVKTRYRQNSVPAVLALAAGRRAEVRFLTRGPAVTRGQACVFYRGEEVLGGGFIERALEA